MVAYGSARVERATYEERGVNCLSEESINHARRALRYHLPTLFSFYLTGRM